MADDLKKSISEIKKLLTDVESKVEGRGNLQTDQDNSESKSGRIDGPSGSNDSRALQNFRTSFPWLSSRTVRHKDQRKMLQTVVPFAIKESWTHEFCCIPSPTQEKTPSAAQTEILNKAGLGKRKIVFKDRNARHDAVVAKLEETFPKLKDSGGFLLFRAKTGGQNRPLTQLQCTWYNIADIRQEVTGAACIYIRPLQTQLSLAKCSQKEKNGNNAPAVNCKQCGLSVRLQQFQQHICEQHIDLSSSEQKAADIIDLDEDKDGLDSDIFDDIDPDQFLRPLSPYATTAAADTPFPDEQDNMYNTSLLEDTDKHDALQHVALSDEVYITENNVQMERREKFRDACKRKTTLEPDAEAADVIPIKFRLPGGETISRRFEKNSDVEVMISFIGGLDSSTPRFHLASPDTKRIDSSAKRQSLSEMGMTSPCTMNVVWDGDQEDESNPDDNINEEEDNPVVDNNESRSIYRNSSHPVEMTLDIRRTFLLHDMVKHFKDPSVLEKKLTLNMINEKGVREEADDLGGVMRDVLSAFWCDFFKGHAVGSECMIPCIRHDFSREDWKAVCRVLIKGFREVRYFPLRLSKGFVVATLFRESAMDDSLLLQSLLDYLPVEDREVLHNAMKDDAEFSDREDDVLELLSTLSAKRVPRNTADLRKVLLEIAHQEIVQRPSYVREAWAEILETERMLRSSLELDQIYESCRPTGKKLVALLHADPTNEPEREALSYLKKLVRGLTPEDLPKFLRFATGADAICVDKIDIIFNKISGYERRIIAHTCGPTLELPVTYTSYVEFKEEVLNILRSGYWNMDFA